MAGKGLLFAGHSTAGKSTMVKMLQGRAEILCDDRNIIRRWQEGFRIHGTWSHGEVSEVSPSSAPLTAVLLLEKARENRIERVEDRNYAVKALLGCLVKPLLTADWWEKMLELVDKLTKEVPCYRMRFDRSGAIVKEIESL